MSFKLSFHVFSLSCVLLLFLFLLFPSLVCVTLYASPLPFHRPHGLAWVDFSGEMPFTNGTLP